MPMDPRGSVPGMGFPLRLLMSDEELVLDLRPHRVVLAVAAIVAAGEAAVAIWLLTLVRGSWNWLVLAGLVVALLAYPVRQLVWCLTPHFVVTSVRIIHREGWIAKRSKDIPLEAINDLRFQQSVLERLVGAGSLVVQSASSAGRQEFRAIREPQEVQKTIYEERRRRMTRLQGGRQPRPSADDPVEPPV